jgi:flagellar M-ring protein FliF
VLRPLLRKHLYPVQAVLPAPNQSSAFAEADPEQAQIKAQVQVQGQERQAQRHLDNLKYAHDMTIKDPQIVASMMKHWIEDKDG